MSIQTLQSDTSATRSPADRRLSDALRLRRLVMSIPPSEIRRRFDYDRRLLPNGFLQRCEEGIDNVQASMPRSGISPGYPSWNLLYYALLATLEPDMVVVETGTHRGISTILLAQAVKDGGLGGKVHTVDIDAVLSGIAQENVAQAGLSEYVAFHVGDSIEFLQGFAQVTSKINFAFLDGDHSCQQVLGEFEAVRERVSGCHGKVFFDNTATGGVAEALAHIRRTYGGNQVEFLNCSWGPHGNVIWQA